MASREEPRTRSSPDPVRVSSRSKSDKKHGRQSPLVVGSSSRPGTPREHHKSHRSSKSPKPKEMVESPRMESPRKTRDSSKERRSPRTLTSPRPPDSPTTPRGTKSPDPNKKTMLKYMIHEVRELRKQLDPNVKDLPRKARHRQSPVSSDGTGSPVFLPDPEQDPSEQRETHESSSEVLRKSDNGEYYEKKYSKREMVMTRRSPSSVTHRMLPAVPQHQSRVGSLEASPVEVQILNQTYPPPGMTRDVGDGRLSRTAPLKATFLPSGFPISSRHEVTEEDKQELLRRLKK